MFRRFGFCVVNISGVHLVAGNEVRRLERSVLVGVDLAALALYQERERRVGQHEVGIVPLLLDNGGQDAQHERWIGTRLDGNPLVGLGCRDAITWIDADDFRAGFLGVKHDLCIRHARFADVMADHQDGGSLGPLPDGAGIQMRIVAYAGNEAVRGTTVETPVAAGFGP